MLLKAIRKGYFELSAIRILSRFIVSRPWTRTCLKRSRI
jgi:hypothetical protein